MSAFTSQNELNGEDAQNLIKNDVLCVGEISNMGCTPEAIDLFIEHKIMYAPGKAVNAGGVATSGLEMSQNAMHLSWSAAEVDEKLHAIMHGIHAQCVKYGTEPDGYINYVKGANIAGFMKVAHAMMGQGVIQKTLFSCICICGLRHSPPVTGRGWRYFYEINVIFDGN